MHHNTDLMLLIGRLSKHERLMLLFCFVLALASYIDGDCEDKARLFQTKLDRHQSIDCF